MDRTLLWVLDTVTFLEPVYSKLGSVACATPPLPWKDQRQSGQIAHAGQGLHINTAYVDISWEFCFKRLKLFGFDFCKYIACLVLRRFQTKLSRT